MYYDMEVDALFVMVASIKVFLNHPTMWIVLAPAFLRYVYKAAIDTFDNEQRFVETKQKFASFIAGNYFVALVLFYLSDHEVTRWYLAGSSVMIIMSFIKSAEQFVKWKRANDLSY